MGRRVVLGQVGGPFGVQGWVRIQSYTDPPGNILDYGRWQLGRAGEWREVEVEDGKVTAKGVLARLAGVATPEAARLDTGSQIAVGREELPEPAPGEYYWSDLEGLQAIGRAGESLGRIEEFRTTPGGPVVVIRGERQHWVPFVKERIVTVDLDAGRVVFDWAADW
ncbi:MAG TPA: ribosome maturation factor RimM [Steroidobacteraceae bacterium]|nr:ribosome maturation factor RimM [Steroidobacteraceae bacterium]